MNEDLIEMLCSPDDLFCIEVLYAKWMQRAKECVDRI